MVDRGTFVDVPDSHLLTMSTKEGGLKTNNNVNKDERSSILL